MAEALLEPGGVSSMSSGHADFIQGWQSLCKELGGGCDPHGILGMVYTLSFQGAELLLERAIPNEGCRP